MSAHPDPVCANPDVRLVKVYGISGEGLFYRCEQCRAAWHRWPEGHPLRVQAQKVMDRWETLRARRNNPPRES